MNGVERYRTLGHPATASVTVTANAVPATTSTITIDGTVYTYGTDFIGDLPVTIARSLVAAINAEPNSELNALPNTQPIKRYWAMYYGRLVRLIATFGGTGGNSLALATNDVKSFTVSGSVFSGGAA
jgi:phage tail sheath gpL-like